MITKLIIFGLLSTTIIQASPSSDAKFEKSQLRENSKESTSSNLILDDKKKSCDEKLAWFEDVAKKILKYYDQYHLKLKGLQLEPDNIKHVQTYHKQFENVVNASLHKYQEDKQKLLQIHDDTARLAYCRKKIDSYQLEHQNLTKIVTNIKENLLNVLNALGLPKYVRDIVEKTLNRIINFLFIVDMTKNLFKDIRSLVRELAKSEKKGEKEKKSDTNDTVEAGRAIDLDYGDEALLDNSELDDQITNSLKDLSDNSEIKKAEERQNQKENNAKEHDDLDLLKDKPYYEAIQIKN